MKNIEVYKNNRLIRAEYTGFPFKRPKLHERLAAERIVGADTESFENVLFGATFDEYQQKYVDGRRTNLTQLDFADSIHNAVLDTTNYEYPLEAVLDHLWSIYAENELWAAMTKQRPKRERLDGNHRDGRRQHIEPVVLIAHNLTYDLGQLLRNHPQFKRLILARDDSYRVQLGRYEIEVASLTPDGSAPAFEFYIRCDHMIMRLLGRDTWAYLKSSLEDASSDFLGMHKQEIDKAWFKRPWESFNEDERKLIFLYAAQDPHLSRLLYEALIVLLTSIDERVICENGILPRSAPGAAARMAFAMASRDEWKPPSREVMQIGAWTYCGARVFSRKPGYYENVWCYDISSAYPHAMTLLPDPATCEYHDIEPGLYNHEQWKGQFGCMLISGRGLDEYYPALRVHDTENKRLRYIYGKFEKVWATIPEVVVGVESGRLQITTVHGGFHIVGSNENSFLRKFVDNVYGLKNSSEPDSPMYLIAKLLMNALYGKLLEVLVEKAALEDFARFVQLPNIDGIDKHYDELMQAYVTGGEDALEDIATELCKQHDGNTDIVFGDLVDRHQGNVGKAGKYYLPMHGAQITGFVSAKLGLFAHCTGALQGDTDSAMTIGDAAENIKQYREIMLTSGYEAPETGLGSFELKFSNAHGYLVRNKLYALKYCEKDKKTGKMVEKLKFARHGIVGAPEEDVYNLVRDFYVSGFIRYVTKERPVPLRESLIRGETIGEFRTEERLMVNQEDPNMLFNECGERVWRPYSDGYRAVMSDDKLRTLKYSANLEQKNTILRSFGYTWKKFDDVWKLTSPTGDEVDEKNIVQFLDPYATEDAVEGQIKFFQSFGYDYRMQDGKRFVFRADGSKIGKMEALCEIEKYRCESTCASYENGYRAVPMPPLLQPAPVNRREYTGCGGSILR